ncbi:hypothetical protein FACS1894110_22960 [Spirochaetia bacterium]|nr:hypothetical protein FACS1894110_22960 [Spirochaetia bacterium]
MIKEFNHISMNVQDIRKTLSFYTEFFGAVFVRGLYIPGGHTAGAYVQIGSNMVEFLSPLSPDGKVECGITHIAFTTDNIEAEVYNLIAGGFKFDIMPRIAGSGSGKIAFLRDPNGASVELVERAESFKREWNSNDDVLGIDHASIYSADLKGAIEFYTKTLGFNMLRHVRDEGRKFDMVYLNHGINILQLLHFEEQNWDAPQMGHMGLLVKDTRGLAKKLSDAGYTVSDPKPLAVLNNGLVATVKDPNGIAVELIDRVSLFNV